MTSTKLGIYRLFTSLYLLLMYKLKGFILSVRVTVSLLEFNNAGLGGPTYSKRLGPAWARGPPGPCRALVRIVDDGSATAPLHAPRESSEFGT